MFNIEMKVNGALAFHITGYNKGVSPLRDQDCIYDYEIYDVGHGSLDKGRVTHARETGLVELVRNILEDYHLGGEHES